MTMAVLCGTHARRGLLAVPPSFTILLLTLLLAPATASTTCTRVTAPATATMDVCTPAWSGGSTAPTTSTSTTLTVSFADGRTGLSAASATVNLLDVVASFVEVSGGAYTVSYTTAAGDEEWPWTGLRLQAAFSDGTTLDAAVVPGATWSEGATALGFVSLSSDERGACVGDVDGDGHVDVFIVGTGGPHALWINNGAGVFTDEATAWGVSGPSSDQPHACALGDFDGDGLLDLTVPYYYNDFAELYMNNGTMFVEEGAARGVRATVGGVGVTVGDTDGDGDLDMLVPISSNTAANYFYINNGTGFFQDEATARGVAAVSTSSTQAAFVDVNDDGQLDVLVAASGTPNLLFVNDGGGDCVEEGLARGFHHTDASSTTAGFGVGDFDGDGDIDLFVSNTDARDFLYVNDGAGVFSEGGTAAGINTVGNSRGIAVFDAELDGDTDIFTEVRATVADSVWFNDGSASFVDGAATLGAVLTTDSHGVVTGDFDGDGDEDALLTRQGSVFVNPNARPGVHRTVVVRPLTVAGAPSAFGATVTLECVEGCEEAWLALRVTNGGFAYFCQSGYDAVFGVPVPDAVYNISVRWPGDTHPVSTWASHPVLGGIVPSSLTTPSAKVFQVRFFSVHATLGQIPPWDVPANGAPVAAGSSVTIPFTVDPPVDVAPRQVVVVVNEVDVTGTLVSDVGSFSVVYTTAAGDEEWPWTGLRVEFVGGGVVMNGSDTAAPGSVFSLSGLGTLRSSSGTGGCMADFDSDGDVDFLALFSASPFVQLWVNDGAGNFVDEASSWGLLSTPLVSSSHLACAFADADGDGLLDVVVTSLTSASVLLINVGRGFVDGGAARGITGVGAWTPTWADVDGDVDVDLLLVSSADGTSNALFINNGRGNFTEDSAARGIASSNSRQAAAGDVDGDMSIDFFVATGGVDLLYINDGLGAFSNQASTRGITVPADAYGISLGDIDGDGSLDAYVTTWTLQRDLLYINNGMGGFTEVGATAGLASATLHSRGIGMFDADHDGDVDVAVGRLATDLFWLNTGGGTFAESADGYGLAITLVSESVLPCDVDGDGDVDLVFTWSGILAMNFNARPGRRTSMFVRPLTVWGAQSMFGATVTVAALSWRAVRVIDGGSGFRSQAAYDAHFGLPHPDDAHTVTVQWPSGAYFPTTLTVVPSAMDNHTLAVWPSPMALRVLDVKPWWGGGTPAPGTSSVVVNVTTAPPTDGMAFVAVTVNGVDVLESLSGVGGGVYSVTYTTAVGDEEWPWAGLSVTVWARGVGPPYTQQVVPGSTWSEESDTRGMATMANSNAYGVCMGDVDGDGDVDVFAAMRSGTGNQLWVNNGSGVFVDEGVARGVAGDASANSYGCGFGDADGDGWVDLAVTRFNENLIELYMNDGGTFVEDGEGRGVSVGDASLGVSWGDVDGDGDVDLFVCSSSSSRRNRLFMNDGTGVFTEDGVNRGVGALTRTSRQSALVDIDGDGDLDILVVNWAAANELYVNGGDGNFEEAAVSRGFADAGNGYGLSVGDWSGDGVVDVYVPNHDSRDLLLLNDWSGVFSEVGVVAGIGGSTGGSIGVMSFDIENDGDLDVVVGVEGDPDYVWLNDGLGGFVDGSADLALGSSASTRGVSAGDIDGDGDVDVIMGYSGSVYVNPSAPGGAGRVIVARPLTAGGAQSAFGAAVRVECVDGCEDGWVGVRVIDGGSSYYSQTSYDAVVGVPVSSATYNASVRWPGDAHPQANATTHPRLGGIVPASLTTSLGDRLFTVRPSPVGVALGTIAPWDFPRIGAPVAGDSTVTVPFSVTPWPSLVDVGVEVVVNGVDVSDSWTHTGEGAFSVEYVTAEGDEEWPWGGLQIEAMFVDGSGLVSSVSDRVVVGSVWSEESSARGLGDLAQSTGRGVCMGDMDNDGDVDVFAVVFSGINDQLWVNSGTGEFTDEAAHRGVVNSSAASFGCGFADVDGDGWLDLLVSILSVDANVLYKNTGGGMFEADDGSRGLAFDKSSLGVSWGDADGDGWVDLYVCTYGDNLLYMNDGGVFTDDATARGAALSTLNGRQAVFVDLSQDGHLDLVVSTSDVDVVLENDGAGYFSKRTLGDSESSLGVAVGAVNGDDGFPDVYISADSSRDFLYVNDGLGGLSETGVAAGIQNLTWNSRSVSMFDFEHDGDLDVLSLYASFTSTAWLNTGAGVFTDAAGPLSLGTLNAYGLAVGDIDGDGDMDALISLRGDVFVNHNARPGRGRALLVRPLTAGGAQSAFGASVWLHCVSGCSSPWVGLRIVDGGSGYVSQNAYDAHFGLPVPSATYNASVRWAGDFHPPSNWTTHPRLGGIMASSLVTAGDRLFTVRSSPVVVTLGTIAPWDFPANGAPTAGDTSVRIPFFVSPPHSSTDMVMRVYVNGEEVSGSGEVGRFGNFSVEYVTAEGDEEWPWVGLQIEAMFVDGSGLVSSVSDRVVVGSVWSEESSARGLGDLAQSTGRGVCMGDMDNDGDVDVAVVFSGINDQLWVNSGTGEFTDEAAHRGVVNSSAASFGCGIADVDGDGWLDLLVSILSVDANVLYKNTGGGMFEADDGSRGLAFDKSSLGVSWGDVDGDGWVDLYVCTYGANLLYMNDGGVFTDDATARGAAGSLVNSQQGVFVDMDNDGDLDAVVANLGVDAVLTNDGAGTFTERGLGDSANSIGVAGGDVNGDGWLDVYVTVDFSPDLLFFNDGLGGLAEAGLVAGIQDSAGNNRAVSMFDFEQDGDVDVLAMYVSGLDMAWVNNGEGAFINSAGPLSLGSLSSYGLAVGDIDGDGDMDALISVFGHLFMNHNARPGWGRALLVRPLTAGGAQSAFGASVRLHCVSGCSPPWVGLRVIGGGSGHVSQNAYDAHFGLPVLDAVYNVSVRWAGDFHPPSNWTTHPRLGGIMASSLVTAGDRLFTVRSSPVVVTLGTIAPWDFPANGAPTAGDTSVRIPFFVSPPHSSTDMVMRVYVNGEEVSGSGEVGRFGNFSVEYVTAEGDEEWPWVGLQIEAMFVDGGGLVSSVSDRVVVGSVWSEESTARQFGAEFVTSAARGVCMGDVDGDGDVDVFVVLASGAVNQLWVNDGAGVFADSAAAWGVLGVAANNSHGCSFGDADGDGLLDLFVVQRNSPNFLYMNTGDVFVEDSLARGVDGASDDSISISWGDVDGDGDADALVCSFNGGTANALLLNNGEGEFVDDSIGRGIAGVGSRNSVSRWFDADNDGDLDAVALTYDKDNEVYVNNGAGLFTEEGGERGLSGVVKDSEGFVAGDWNGDGSFDLYITNWLGVDDVYWNDGSAVFSHAGFQALSSASVGVLNLDLELDGDVDVVVGVNSGADLALVNNGMGGFRDAGLELGLGTSVTSQSVVAGDVDGDGDLDVVMGQSGLLFINHNVQPSVTRSLFVRPLTAVGAQSAFGATVVVECVAGCREPWMGVRVTEGSSGYSSQNAYDAHFGLPVPSATYNASVRWAGDSHPPSNWTTHPRLGGIMASSLVTAGDRLFTVRPSPPALTFGFVVPWDFPGVTARVGQLPEAPGVGTSTVAIPLDFSCPDCQVIAATVNDFDVLPTLTSDPVAVEYTTQAGEQEWPWAGLRVSATLVDGGGLIATTASTIIAGSTFEEDSADRGLDVAWDNVQGVCVGDVNHDSLPDFFFPAPSTAVPQLWVSTTPGQYEEQTEAWGLPTTSVESFFGCAFGDANGDGLLDLFIGACCGSQQLLFVHNGTGFQGSTAGLGNEHGHSGRWGDVDGDGDIDLYIPVGRTDNDALYLNDGNATFEASTASRIDSTDTTSQALLVDTSGDGNLDVVIVYTDAPGKHFVNNGVGEFAVGVVGLALPQGLSIVAGDLNCDGRLDVFLATGSYGSVDMLASSNPDGTFTVAAVSSLRGSVSKAPVVADFDMDGDVDVFVGMDGHDVLYSNLGCGSLRNDSVALGFAVAPFLAAEGAAAADLDNDGDLDIVVAQAGSVYINHNARGVWAAWMKVRPLTAASALSAHGSVVRAACVSACPSPWTALRVIDGGSGLYSQSGYDAHFGLPSPSAAYNVTVTWAGNVHPQANFTSHPRLGGIHPAARPLPEDRLFIVRPVAFGIVVGMPEPWDFAGTTSRPGLQPGRPSTGATVNIPLFGAAGVTDLSVVLAVVNGQNVADTFTGDGEFAVTYITPATDVNWPTTGLRVEVVLEDSAGLQSATSATVVPGSTVTLTDIDARTLGDAAAGGVCAADVDGDGALDVFIAGGGGPNQLWVHDGAGGYEDMAGELGVVGGSALGCGFSDVTGNGKLDLFVVLDGGVQLFVFNGTVFEDEWGVRGVPVSDSYPGGVALGDVDGNGWVDALMCGSSSPNALLLNTEGSFTDEAPTWNADSAPPCVGAVLFDADGDTLLDAAVFTAGPNPNELLISTGAAMNDLAGGRSFALTTSSSSELVADFDGNGALDVFVSAVDGTHALLLNDGVGFFTDVSTTWLASPTSLHAGGSAGDWDLDGDVDMVLGGLAASAASATLFANDGTGFRLPPAGIPDAADDAAGVVSADLDGDGDVDTFVSGVGALLRNNNAVPGVRNWVVVRPVTSAGSPSAFGAVVRVAGSSAWTAMRSIGVDTRASQGGYDAVFGVPDVNAVYSVSVDWVAARHPQANATTHPRLGGIQPAALPAASRVFVVRPAAVSVELGVVRPWDVASTVDRIGQQQRAPIAGDPVTVPIVSPVSDMTLVLAVVNGVDVTPSVAHTGTTLTVTYETVAGGEAWPWEGLSVEAVLSDSGGLLSSLNTTVVPGSTHAALPSLSLASAHDFYTCVLDFDGDGRLDVFASRFSSSPALWHNTGDGFVNVAAEWGLAPMGTATDCAVTDLFGDGRPDVLVINDYGAADVFLVNNGTGFEPRSLGLLGTANHRGAALGDLDADGDVDVYVTSKSSQANQYFEQQDGMFVLSTDAAGLGSPGDCKYVDMADVTGDGHLDVLIAIADIRDVLFVNAGDGTFTNEAVGRGFGFDVATYSFAVADMNGDGFLDVFFAGIGALSLNDGAGYFATTATTFPSTWFGAWADINLDGDVDLVLSGGTPGPAHVLLAPSFEDTAVGFGVSGAASLVGVSTADLDDDGDLEVLFSGTGGAAFSSTAARSGAPSWLVVRALSGAGRETAHGSTVRVSSRCSPWQTARQVASGGAGTAQYASQFGVPDPACVYDVSVAYPGASFHDKSTQPHLGGVPPGTTVTVLDLPYWVDVRVEPASGLVGVGAELTVVLTASRLTPDFVAGGECCFVNGVQTRGSFANRGGGVYALTYVLEAGDASWATNSLQVVAPVFSPSLSSNMTAVVSLPPSPAGDTLPPAVEFVCGPGAASPLRLQPLCASCPTEAPAGRSCSVSYTVFVNAALRQASTLVSDMASPTQADFTVGPFDDTNVVRVVVDTTDEAGNTATAALEWLVDATPPETTLQAAPNAVAGSSAAFFSMLCSETPCSFAYELDDGPLTPLGGNATSLDGSGVVVDTVVVQAPARVSPDDAPVVGFVVAAAAVVNASVEVVLVGSPLEWVLPVVNGTNATAALQLPGLADSAYSLRARGRGGDGTIDLSPVLYEFEVDTRPPEVTLLRRPADGDPDSTATFVFAASEDDCRFEWRAAPVGNLSGARWGSSDVGVAHVANVSSGVDWGFEVRGVDPAGNAGPVVGHAWSPATCPPAVPAVTLTPSPPAVGLGTRFVAFWCEDPLWAAFEYAVDGGEWVATTRQDVLVEGVSPGGAHRVAVRAAAPGVCGVVLEGSRPAAAVVEWVEPPPLPLEVTVVGAPPLSTPSVFAEFELVPSRSLAWVEYRVDGGVRWAPCSRSLTLGPLAPGDHSVEFRAVDGGGGGSGAVQAHAWTVTSTDDSEVEFVGLPDGGHDLRVTATDLAGLVEEAPKTHRWRVDTVPPETFTNRTSRQFSTSRTVVVEVSCGGEVDPCEYCWESTALQPGCTNATILALTAEVDGSHTVAVWAVDTAGWVDTTPNVVAWTVDSTPPTTAVFAVNATLVPPPEGVAGVDFISADPRLHLNVSANEALSGFVATVDGAPWPEGAQPGVPSPVQPLVLRDLDDGVVSVRVAGEDLAGNRDGVGVEWVVLVDTQAPETSWAVPPPTLTNVGNVTVVPVVVDGGSTVAAVSVVVVRGNGSQVGNATVGSGTEVAFTGLASGVYNVSAVGVDFAGNEDASPVAAVVEVDLVPPVTAFAVQPPPVTSNDSLWVSTTASEVVVSVEARLSPAGAWVAGHPGSGVVVLPGVQDGVYGGVEARSVDRAGNVEPPPYAAVSVIVDRTSPAVEWVEVPPVATQESLLTACARAEDITNVTLSSSVGPMVPAGHNQACFSVDLGADGATEVTISAVDAALNVALDALRHTVVLDRVAPTAVVTGDVPQSHLCSHVNGLTSCPSPSAATLVVTCDDNTAGGVVVSECELQAAVQLLQLAEDSVCGSAGSGRRLAGVEWGTIPGGVATPLTTDVDGLYSVAVRAVDAAGNTQLGNHTVEWHVDSVAPTVSPQLLETPARAETLRTAVFLMQQVGDVSPGQSRFVYSLDGGPEAEVVPTTNTAPVSLTLSDLGADDHSLEVVLRDQAGHDGPPTVYTWAVVDEAPAVALVATPAAVSGDASPSFSMRAVWPPGTTRNTSLLGASVQVSVAGSEFEVACVDTAATNGLCVWNATLTAPDTYTLTTRAVFGGATGDPTTHTWSYTLCEDDQFAELGANMAISCLECPAGANCEGGLTSQADLVATPGHWAPPGASGLRFYSCPIEEACLAGGEVVVGNDTSFTLGRCAEGYTGTLCAVCEDGFFAQFGQCVACGTSAGTAWAITAGIVVAVGVGAALFFKFREVLPKDQLKVMLSFTQIIASANTAYAIPWPPLFTDFMNTMRVFLVEAVSLTRASCAQPMTFYASLAVTLVGFKLLLAAVVLLPVAVHKVQEWRRRVRAGRLSPPQAATPAPPQPALRRGSSRRASLTQAMAHAVHAARDIDWAKVFKITFLFLFVAYPGVSLKIMKTFKCVEVEGAFWLVEDMRLKCYEGEWYGYALYAFVMGCLYTGGLPLAIVVILFKHRHTLESKETHAKWGFLYETYGAHAYLWEACELLRKLWLGALVVLMSDGSPLQVTTAVLVSGWAHVLHSLYKPWKGGSLPGGRQVYALQHGSLLLTFFVFLMGLLFKVEGVDEDGATYTGLSWAMTLACAAFVFAGACLLLHVTVGNFRSERARRMLTKPPSTARRGTVATAQAWAGSGGARRQPSMPRNVRTSMLGVGRQGSWMSNPLRKGTLGEVKEEG